MQLAIFKYEENKVTNDFTTIEVDGEVWFLAKDVCALLEIQNVSREVASLDEDEKLMYQIRIAGQMRDANFVNESGLYTLVFKSKKPSAKKFRKWVTKEVIPSVRKTGSYSVTSTGTPNFVRRYNDNWDRIEKGRFSVISELFIRLYGRFERIGYNIPDKALSSGKEIRPDVSVGKLFAQYLRDKHPDKAADFIYYLHLFPDGNEFNARQYQNDLLPLFIAFVDQEWLPKCAQKYFNERDKIALDYLPKLLT